MNPLQQGGGWYYPDIGDDPPAAMRDFESWSRARQMAGPAEGGLYFPDIARNVGRGGPSMGPGMAVPPAPPMTGRNLPLAPPAPTDYYPDIAGTVGLAPGQAMPTAPPSGPPSAPPPSAAPPGDIGPGIALPPDHPTQPFDPSGPVSGVTSFDLPRGVSAPMAMAGGGGRFNPQDMFNALTAAGPPPSRRYSSTRPEFIYTNPASAQQAAANYQARLGYEQGQDQGYRQYSSQLAGERQATERAQATTEAARINEANRLAAAQQEGAANRASSERIAGMTEAVRQHRQAEADWQAYDHAWRAGQADADTLNKDPNMVQRVGTKNVKIDPVTGKWVPKWPNPGPRPAPPSFLPQGAAPAVPTQSQPPPPSMAVPAEEQPQPGPSATPSQPQSSPGIMSRIGSLIGWTTPAAWPWMLSRQ